jgi:hypothetical protein
MTTLHAPADRDVRARRLILATVVAIAAGVLSYQNTVAHPGDLPPDFGQAWGAARAWVHGTDPYAAVGPHRFFEWRYPLLYPLPAVVVALPFSFLPLAWAAALFVALSTWAFVWAVTRRRLFNPTLCVFGSLAFLYVIQTAQWSPLIVASILLPWLAPLWVCKPTIGAALLVAYPRRRTVMAGAVFALATVLLLPSWPREWRAALEAAPHVRPLVVQTLVGPLVLLALLRWRRSDARLLVALACVPQTPLLYETVPLFLIARTYLEGATLAVLTFVAWILWQRAGPFASYGDAMSMSGRFIVWCVYLPCTLMVLRRPNAADAESSGTAIGG